MENKLRNKCIVNSNTPSLAMHKDSHIVSKTKPKIRIIHIFAPEVIKTDVENFRELVQKLTGKPSGGEKYCKNTKTRRSIGKTEENRVIMKKKEQGNAGFCWERIKEEVGICNDESSGGYLGGFSDLEGTFISEIGRFPLLPLDSTHLQGFEEPQLLL